MSGADRLSDLPEHLIHKIMSYLRSSEPARLSAVSKRLYTAYNSSPSLHFDSFFWRFREDTFFPAALNLLRRRLSFAAAPLNSLTLNFYLYQNSGYSFPPVLHSAAVLLLEISAFTVSHGFSHLRIHCHGDTDAPGGIQTPLFLHHRTPLLFPSEIFSSAKLKSVALSGINFASPELVVDCPLLKIFHLAFCSGLTSVEFRRSDAERISINGCAGLKRVCVRGAEGLRQFFFSGCSVSDEPCRISVGEDSLRRVQLLSVNTSGVGDEWFEEIVPKLVSLEVLVVKYCNQLRNLRVKNKNLKQFELAGCSSIECIDVAVPGLETFVIDSAHWIGNEQVVKISECSGLKNVKIARKVICLEWVRTNLLPLLCLEDLKLDGCVLDSDSDSEKSLRLLADNLRNVELGFYTDDVHNPDVHNPQVFEKRLWEFFYLFGHCNTLLLPVKESMEHCFMMHSGLRNMDDPPLCDVKHLKIRVGVETSEDRIVQMVDNFLSLAPNLETLTFFNRRGYFWKPLFSVKFHRGLEGEGSELICCLSFLKKCWLHGLKEIVIEKHDDNDIKILHDFFVERANTCRITVS